VIVENQPVVFAKKLVVYTSSAKSKAKTVLKERKDREITQRVLHWFTLYQELHPVLSNH